MKQFIKVNKKNLRLNLNDQEEEKKDKEDVVDADFEDVKDKVKNDKEKSA